MIKEKAVQYMENDSHNQIIKQVCKEILLPIGVFQKGTSRVYLDDNGYFFTVIEFQPSANGTGTYLNVGLHFLWNERDCLSYDFPREFRIGSLVVYENDAQFTRQVTCYAQKALRRVLYFRKHTPDRWKTRKMLGDAEILGKIRQTRAAWRRKPSMQKMKYFEGYDISLDN